MHSFQHMGIIAVAAVAFGCMSLGCSSDDDETNKDNGASCDAALAARADAVASATAAIAKAGDNMKVAKYAACAAIARDLDVPDAPEALAEGTVPQDDEVRTTCAMAEDALAAAAEDAGGVSLSLEGGLCTVDAKAQLDCEAACNVKAKCQPSRDIETRCDASELSVRCDGTCAMGSSCEGSAKVPASCEGSCDGTCQGDCSSGCSASADDGTCNGTCDGTCTGTCTGNCRITAEDGVSCGDSAPCNGECKGTGTAPACHQPLDDDPTCESDAACATACAALGASKAECGTAVVHAGVTGSSSSALVSTLEANLPAIATVMSQGRMLAEVAMELGPAAEDVVSELEAVPDCLAEYDADLAETAASAAMAIQACVDSSTLATTGS